MKPQRFHCVTREGIACIRDAVYDMALCGAYMFGPRLRRSPPTCLACIVVYAQIVKVTKPTRFVKTTWSMLTEV